MSGEEGGEEVGCDEGEVGGFYGRGEGGCVGCAEAGEGVVLGVGWGCGEGGENGLVGGLVGFVEDFGLGW